MACEDDHFPRFLDLPFELREQIWKEALPKPGIFLVYCDYDNIVHTDHRGDRQALRLALGPAREGPHDSDYQERVRTNKSLLATCLESRAVVNKRFPDTLDDAGPRLSFREDLVYVDSVLIVGFSKQVMPAEVEIEFEGGWNELIHRLAFNCDRHYTRPVGVPGMTWKPRRRDDVEGFMEFLTTCTSLKQLFLSTQWGISLDLGKWIDDERRPAISSKIVDCYGGLTCQPGEPLVSGAVDVASLMILSRQFILNELKGDKYPALKDLEISLMLHVSRELRFLCRNFA